MEKGPAAGRVGSDFLSAISGRVGSGRVNVSPGRVESKKSDPWITLVLLPNPATFLRDFTHYMTTNYVIIKTGESK